jgi:hypothetical protein
LQRSHALAAHLRRLDFVDKIVISHCRAPCIITGHPARALLLRWSAKGFFGAAPGYNEARLTRKTEGSPNPKSMKISSTFHSHGSSANIQGASMGDYRPAS